MAQKDSRGGGLEAAFTEQAEFLIRSMKTVKFSIDALLHELLFFLNVLMLFTWGDLGRGPER